MGDFWDACGPETRDAISTRGRTRVLKRGTVLCHDGDDMHEVFVIVDGLAKVSRTVSSGRQVILNVVDSGDILGELTAVDPEPCSADVELLADSTVLRIPVAEFRRLVTDEPELALVLLRLLARRLRNASQRQLEFGAVDALGRLTVCLVDLADRYGARVGATLEVELPYAQHELAAAAGLSREAVVKGLRSLRSLGWVAVDGRTVTFLDEAAVRDRAAV